MRPWTWFAPVCVEKSIRTMIEPFWHDVALEHDEHGPLTLGDKKVLRWLARSVLEKRPTSKKLKQRQLERVVALTKLSMKLERLWPETERGA